MRWKRYLSVGLAVLTCPCHLPLLLGVLAGTALGGWLSRYTWLVFPAMLGVFVLSLWYSVRAFNRRDVSPSTAAAGRATNGSEVI
jgi:mercuric ion transport protein